MLTTQANASAHAMCRRNWPRCTTTAPAAMLMYRHRRSCIRAQCTGNMTTAITATNAPDPATHELCRRSLLLASSVAAVWVAGASLPLQPARATGLGDLLTQTFPPPPQPVQFPRKAVDQRFAVLLMRSSYEAVDALNFIPMGDLTDPLYFDFIAFSQYATISREMARPQQVFKEACMDPAECPSGEYRVVRRDAALTDALLPAAFSRAAGDLMYAGLLNGFQEKQFGAPPPLQPGASLDEVVHGVRQLLDVMCASGYALKAEVDAATSAAAPGFNVRLLGPLNLWGLTALQYRRALIANAYDAMVIEAFLRASGRHATYKIGVSDVGVEEVWLMKA